MPVSLNFTNSWIQHQGNNSTSDPYEINFVFHENADLRVIATTAAGVDIILNPGDFIATGAGQDTGGSLITTAPYDNTHRVTIYREVEATQKTVYEENADFPAKSHERALDKLTMLGQQLLRTARRSFRFRESDGETDEIPKVPNSVLTIGAGGDPVFLTAGELASFLNLQQQFFDRPTKTFANAAERALAAPEFVGQLGAQRDVPFPLWIATGTAAGNWAAIPIPANHLTLAMMPDGYLTASAGGRAKMADKYITALKAADGTFTADAAGRLPFAAGFVNSSLCTSGLFAAIAPVGAVINSTFTRFTTLASITSSFVNTDAIPQNTEGTQVMTGTITPLLANSLIRVTMILAAAQDSTGGITFMAGFRDSVANAMGAGCGSAYAGGADRTVIQFEDSPGVAGVAVTYKMRAGTNTGTVQINGYRSAGRKFGGSQFCSILCEEIKQ